MPLDYQRDAIFQENYEAIDHVLTNNGLLFLNRGAEIGVRNGYFSRYLLQKHPDLMMILVDPYEAYQDVDKYRDQAELDESKIAGYNTIAKAGFESRVWWIYQKSIAASKLLPDGYLDFAFIDAEHTYEAVKQDIAYWYRTVKPGGLVCGHDYNMTPVQQAVNDSLADDHTIHHLQHPADVWFVQKDEERLRKLYIGDI